MKTIVDYARKVKEQHALSKNLAPVEADASASSKAYAIGQHFILNGELYKAKTAIALGDALVLDTNYEAAGSIEAQIETLDAENQTLTNQANDMVNVLSAKNLWSETIPPTANVGGSYTLANHEYVVSTTANSNSGIYWPTDKLLPFYADMVGVSAKLSFEVKADAPMRAYTGFYNNEVNLTTEYQTIEQDIADLSQIASTFKVYNLDTASAHTISMKNVMIRPSNITSDAYVPYAMTNRELTELVTVEDLSSQVTLTENCFSCSLLRQGNICHVNVAVKSGVNGFTSIATVPTALKPKYNTPMACFAVAGADSPKIEDAVLNTNGLISIRTTSATSDIAYLSCTWIV